MIRFIPSVIPPQPKGYQSKNFSMYHMLNPEGICQIAWEGTLQCFDRPDPGFGNWDDCVISNPAPLRD